ncbi:MAG: hypothetical protein E7193_05220 [Erysipelotrichaceae bacterium]|nr:hypothetical protein [Erysipelotrichaceae bacterium]MBQ2685527.1 hypothetical protein [Erysipelotrichaceae bacterium]MBR2599997.1 hypothetical protein [Erysipelotrichaceae bacterium]MBR2791915.1 hypothetical protein [Erysipelotrichaceae bacterium]MBR3352249.1 hypothetical protein [Erysipelotrichaceae bacterium]
MANSVGRNTMKASDLRGVSIYQEKKRTVYYDVLNKNGYIINNAEVKNYMLFSNRHTAIALGAVVIYYLTNNVVLSVGLGIAALIATEIVFRKTFLHKLPEITAYERPKKQSYVDSIATDETVTRIILLIVIGILLAFMLIYNIATGVYKDQLSVIMSYMVIAGAIVLTVLHGIALIKKLTNKNK